MATTRRSFLKRAGAAVAAGAGLVLGVNATKGAATMVRGMDVTFNLDADRTQQQLEQTIRDMTISRREPAPEVVQRYVDLAGTPDKILVLPNGKVFYRGTPYPNLAAAVDATA